jgi:hypothetical protein
MSSNGLRFKMKIAFYFELTDYTQQNSWIGDIVSFGYFSYVQERGKVAGEYEKIRQRN